MPIENESQRRLMNAAAQREGGFGGVSQEAARKFLEHGDDADLPPFWRKVSSDAAAEKSAAGILHVAPDGDVLLLHRAKGEKNFGGHWSLPGGNVEPGEEPAFGARREAVEEMGLDAPDGSRRLLDRVTTPTGMAFHTYVQPVPNKFAPKLNGEHSGYTWTSPANLPHPMHPAVEGMIRDRVGVAKDMKPEEWDGLRDGFMAWLAEEQAEPEHLENGNQDGGNQEIKVRVLAQDCLPLAMDRDSVRFPDEDGRLHITSANICKAGVSPYFGYEIPGYDEETQTHALGLDPQKKYFLLRDPQELERSVATANRVPLLRKHEPSSADEHPQMITVGTVGSNAKWSDPYVTNDLAVWMKEDVDAIESKKKRELSPGYKYTPDMTPGTFGGIRYDGVMRDIRFNHVALVETGRQGPDIIVGDSAEGLMNKAALAAAARQLTIGSLHSYLRPLMALDAKIEVSPILSKLTGKQFAADTAGLAKQIATKHGLAQDNAGLKSLLDALANSEKTNEDAVDPAMQSTMEASAAPLPALVAPPPANDEGSSKLADFLKSKGMGEDDIKAACDMWPKAGPAKDEEEETEEEKKAREAKPAEDAEEDDDEKKKKEGQAMDEKVKAAVGEARKQERARGAAFDTIRPYVGEIAPKVAMALDSAPAVFRHALKMLNVTGAADLHESALETVLTMQPKPGDRPQHHQQQLANDSATAKDFSTRFPGVDRFRPAQ